MRYRGIFFGLLIGLIGILAIGIKQSTADQTTGGGRSRTVTVDVNQYNWQVVSNQTGKILCLVTIEYDRQPSADEVLAACADVINPSIAPTTTPNTIPVPTPQSYTSSGFLNAVHYTLKDVQKFSRTIVIPMQDMTVDIQVPDTAMSSAYVVLTAYEPEPDYKITDIHGTLNSVGFLCSVDRCRVPIQKDSVIEFWALSSFGDESQHVTATIRIFSTANGYTLTLDSLYPVKLFADSCSQIWGNTPGVPPPDWATFPSSPAGLNTNKKYFYLVRQLIRNQIVDAKDCPGGGFLSDGSPNACGMERAQTEMVRWQNQYDTMVWSSGRNLGVPPVFIKTLIEVESQFWPANVRYYMYEFGLAQINQYGADVALRWDSDLYKQVCNGLFYDCSLAYASQSASLQAILRGGLVRTINADCPACKNGIDFSQAVESVPLIARVLRSNCSQAKYIFDQYNVHPAYEDAWKFTLVSYHSGYYCLDNAIHTTTSQAKEVTWANVSPNISSNCFGGAAYVDDFFSSLTSFSTYRIKPDLSPDKIPISSSAPTPVPSATPTGQTVSSKLRIIAYVDKNQNGVVDAGEGVDNLTVNISVGGGKSYSQKTANGGVALFDMSGNPVNSTATIVLPTQFKSKTVIIPATGEVQVIFVLEQAFITPVVP